MGVTYKLKDEVVQFIISQRQGNPLFSCRQLAESASQKFGVHLSKSSVHGVLKESGIMSARGRKPKDKFKIPQEKKNQIQSSLSQAKLLPPAVATEVDLITYAPEPISVIPAKAGIFNEINLDKDPGFRRDDMKAYQDDMKVYQDDMGVEISPVYEGAGRIFLKAARWDLGIFSEEPIKESDWAYFLTYSKGVKVVLENNKEFFIDMLLPIERCIREVVDGLINNIRPFIVNKVSDEDFFNACMDAQAGFKISKISIVDRNDHELLIIDTIVDFKRSFIQSKMVFLESFENNPSERIKSIFFSQKINIEGYILKILDLKGFDSVSTGEYVVSLIIENTYENKEIFQEAVERLNGMYLRDEQNRLVVVKIQEI